MSGKILKYLILLAFVLLIAAISSFWFSGPSFREKDVVFELDGPTQITSGEEVVYKLKYANETRSTLYDLEFDFLYPEGSVVLIDIPQSIQAMKEAIAQLEKPLETVVYSLKYAKADVVAEKLTVNYSDISFDPVSNILRMTVTVSGPGFAKVDEKKILSDLLGKKQAQIESYLKSVPNITSANVLLSPVWVRSVPKNSEKVHITVSR